MIATDGRPTIANAGARGPDRNSRRRWLQRRREERDLRIQRALVYRRAAQLRREED